MHRSSMVRRVMVLYYRVNITGLYYTVDSIFFVYGAFTPGNLTLVNLVSVHRVVVILRARRVRAHPLK